LSANKSAPANRKKGFYANRDLNKKEVGFFLFEAAQQFDVFSSIQTEIKKSKTYSG
jgi:hypothetical protein